MSKKLETKPEAPKIDMNASEKSLALVATNSIDLLSPLKIKTEKDRTIATDRIRAIKDLYKEIDRDRENTIDKLRPVLDYLYAKERAVRVPLEKAEKALRSGVQEFERLKIEQVEAKALKIASKKNASEEETTDIVRSALLNVKTREGETSTLVWDFKIIDPTKVPAYLGGQELRPIHEPAIRKYIQTNGEIPGVQTFQTCKIGVKL